MSETTQPATEPFKPRIPFDDFLKIDLRVATIVACEHHPNADKLLKIRLDDGSVEGRQVCAGIRGYYEPDELIGKQVIIVANLEPRTIRGEVSDGMILAASNVRDGSERDVIVLQPQRPAAAGSVVS